MGFFFCSTCHACNCLDRRTKKYECYEPPLSRRKVLTYFIGKRHIYGDVYFDDYWASTGHGNGIGLLSVSGECNEGCNSGTC